MHLGEKNELPEVKTNKKKRVFVQVNNRQVFGHLLLYIFNELGNLRLLAPPYLATKSLQNLQIIILKINLEL